jgi:hypothetical protein
VYVARLVAEHQLSNAGVQPIGADHHVEPTLLRPALEISERMGVLERIEELVTGIDRQSAHSMLARADVTAGRSHQHNVAAGDGRRILGSFAELDRSQSNGPRRPRFKYRTCPPSTVHRNHRWRSLPHHRAMPSS